MSFLESILSGIGETAMKVINLMFGTFFKELTKGAEPMKLFSEIFGGKAAALDQAIQTIAIAIGILIVLWISVQTLISPGGQRAESPLAVVGRSLIFLPLTVMAGKLCSVLFSLESAMMTVLVQAGDLPPDQEVDIGARISNSVTGAVGKTVGTVVVILFALILVLILFIDLFKLAAAIVEQYITIGILMYLGPLAIATGCSKRTSIVFTSWINMFISHLLLLLLSQWSIIVFRSAVENVNAESGAFLWILAIDAFLRISASWDQILSKLGLKAFVDGGGLTGSFMMAQRMMPAVRGAFRGIGKFGGKAIATASNADAGKVNSLGSGIREAAQQRAQDPGKTSGWFTRTASRSAWGNAGAAAGWFAASADVKNGHSRNVAPGRNEFAAGRAEAYSRKMQSDKVPPAMDGHPYKTTTVPQRKLDLSEPALKTKVDSAGRMYGDGTSRSPKARETADTISRYMSDSGRTLSGTKGSHVSFSGNMTASSWSARDQAGSFYTDSAKFTDEQGRMYGRMDCAQFVVYKPDDSVRESFGNKEIYTATIGGEEYLVEPVGELLYTNSAGEVLANDNRPLEDYLHRKGAPIGGLKDE